MADNIDIKDAAGATKTVATRDVSSVHYQLVIPYQQNRSDTYTGTGSGTAIDVSSVPCSRMGIQVKGTGAAPTSWTVLLEGSINGTDYDTLATHDTAEGDGGILFVPLPAPVKKFRSRCSALSLGGATNIVASIIGQAGA
jgi:hypothetical protein